MLYSITACNMCSLSSHASQPLNPVNAQYAKYKSPNHSDHGQCIYVFNIDTAAKYWVPVLALTISGECIHR